MVWILAACGGEDTESCADCRDEKCADLLSVCDGDADCACMGDCIGERGIDDVDACLGECGLSARPPAFVPLETCVATACPDDDECSAPADFVAADAAVGADDDCGGGDYVVTAADGSGDSIGSGELADCGFDTALGFDPVGEVLQLQSADGEVCVRVERRNEGAGSLANTEWTLLAFTVGPAGEVVHIEDRLCWYSSHHNFNDWAHASTASRHYDLYLTLDDHGGNRAYTLYTFERGDAEPASCAPLASGQCAVGDAIELLPVSP